MEDFLPTAPPTVGTVGPNGKRGAWQPTCQDYICACLPEPLGVTHVKGSYPLLPGQIVVERIT